MASFFRSKKGANKNKEEEKSTELCPLCSKVVYSVEKMQGGGHFWHKTCFKCSICKRAYQNNSTDCAFHTNGFLYCKGKCLEEQIRIERGVDGKKGKASNPSLSNAIQSTPPKAPAPQIQKQVTVEQKLTSNVTPNKNEEKCFLCKRVVYAAERVQGAGRFWHKSCFRCTICKRAFHNNASDCVVHTNELLYCCGKCLNEQIRIERGVDGVPAKEVLIPSRSSSSSTFPTLPPKAPGENSSKSHKLDSSETLVPSSNPVANESKPVQKNSLVQKQEKEKEKIQPQVKTTQPSTQSKTITPAKATTPSHIHTHEVSLPSKSTSRKNSNINTINPCLSQKEKQQEKHQVSTNEATKETELEKGQKKAERDKRINAEAGNQARTEESFISTPSPLPTLSACNNNNIPNNYDWESAEQRREEENAKDLAELGLVLRRYNDQNAKATMENFWKIPYQVQQSL